MHEDFPLKWPEHVVGFLNHSLLVIFRRHSLPLGVGGEGQTVIAECTFLRLPEFKSWVGSSQLMHLHVQWHKASFISQVVL